MRKTMAALGLLAVIGMAGPAMACKGKTVLFEDDFKMADPGWDVDQALSIDFGGAKLTTAPNKGWSALYSGSIFEDADFCIDMTFDKASDNSAAGILFWAQDYGHYYWLALTPAGDFAVYRITQGRWLTPVTKRKADSAKPGTGQANRLRVVTKGNVATVFVNDKQVIAFKGQPPTGGGQIGLRSENDTVAAFGNLKITSNP